MSLRAALTAEWAFVRRRVLRTRLGLWILALTAGTVLIAAQAAQASLAGQLARLGLLTGILGVAFTAASERDRAAVRLTLTHPATPARLLAARGAGLVVLAVAALGVTVLGAAPARGVGPGPAAAALAGGIAAAAAGIGAGFAGAALGGTGLVGALFAAVALASPLPPEAWRDVVHSPALRLLGTVLLEALPALWRYRRLAEGDVAAWLHALGWAAGGVAFAAWRLGRWRR